MSHDYEILQLASMGAELDDELASRYRVLQAWDGAGSGQGVLEQAGGVRLVITSARVGLDAATMDLLPDLRAVCSWGVGYDTLDVDAAAQRGIVISNTPDVLDDCVADMAWALLLSAARRTAIADRYVKTGQWRTLGAFPLTTRVWGKRLGILGLGRIGMAIAERASGFRMEVRYTNRSRRADTSHIYEPDLKSLAAWADFLVVACPGGPATRHIVDAGVLQALGPAGILVNVARGSVVDQQAMLRALEDGTLGGAGLDVLENEPGAPVELMSMDQVSLTPHMASATHETRREMAELLVRNVVLFMDTGRLLTPVSETPQAPG